MLIPLLVAAAAERPPAVPAPVERVDATPAVLSTGMRVVVLHEPTSDVAIVVAVSEGGLADQGEPGLARALADGWLSAAPSRVANQDLYARFGARAEAQVELDATVVVARGPAAALPRLLELERRRLHDPLAGSPEVLGAGPSPHGRWWPVVNDALFPPGHPYHGTQASPDPEGFPLYVAQGLATRTWTPDRTTLVVAGPMPPAQVLCELDTESCGGAPEGRTLEAALAPPDPDGLDVLSLPLPEPRFRDLPLTESQGPLAIFAWSLPGESVGASALAAFGADRVQRALTELPGLAATRCRVRPGRVNQVLLCVAEPSAGFDPSRVRRRLARGWSSRGLAEEVDRFRRTEAASLLGTSRDVAQVRRLALEVHAGKEPTVHGGALEALGFDHVDAARFLDEVLGERRLVLAVAP